jgi:hypothetical protein
MKPRNINQALQLLPRDLDETYERILARVPAGNAQEALSALNWVTFAIRPLFIEELIEICAIHLESDPEFDREERYLPGDILDLLPGLLTITPALKASDDFMYNTHVVTFAHFSVHEYLLGDGSCQALLVTMRLILNTQTALLQVAFLHIFHAATHSSCVKTRMLSEVMLGTFGPGIQCGGSGNLTRN